MSSLQFPPNFSFRFFCNILYRLSLPLVFKTFVTEPHHSLPAADFEAMTYMLITIIINVVEIVCSRIFPAWRSSRKLNIGRGMKPCMNTYQIHPSIQRIHSASISLICSIGIRVLPVSTIVFPMRSISFTAPVTLTSAPPSFLSSGLK